MSERPLFTRGVVALQQDVAAGRLSARELTRAFLERIGTLDGELHAFLHVDVEGALAQAETVDRARERGQAPGPLAGVPIALKDNLCTRGVPTTCGSRMLEGYRPPYDAHVVQRLREAGAVVLGKLNMDEFAMGSSNEASVYGACCNPWKRTHVPGGSSGGAAAAVAAGLCAASLGSDTGGSVRQPGSFCGVTALKPTYGRMSRHGLVAFASSLDQVGPLARDARDTARVARVIAGRDERDATSVDHPVDDYEQACGRPLKGMRLGLVREASGEGVDPEVAATVEQAVRQLEALGCSVRDVPLPHSSYAVAAYYIVAPAEASSNLARFDGMRYGLRVEADDLRATYERTRAEGFGPEVKRRIMLGTYVLSAGYYDAFYLKAQKARTLIRRDYEHAFESCDFLVTPTAPTPAFALGEKVDDPLGMYLQDMFTLPPSLAGIPALSVPCGTSADGLPIGLQLSAPTFREARLLQVAAAYETASEWGARLAPGY